jgi:HSP20 family protein
VVLSFDPFAYVELRPVFVDRSGSSGRPMPIDVHRFRDHYVVDCELPGVDPGSVDVSLVRGLLTISAQRSPRSSEAVRWLRRERPTGRFQRRLTLGDDLDQDGIAATYQDGVLTVTIPVSERARGRRVPIASPQAVGTLEGTATEVTYQPAS